MNCEQAQGTTTAVSAIATTLPTTTVTTTQLQAAAGKEAHAEPARLKKYVGAARRIFIVIYRVCLTVC